MKSKSQVLQKELRSAGAKLAEASELAVVADRLSLLKSKAKSRSPKPLWLRLTPFGATAAVFLVIGAALIIFSQAVMPGNLLYGLQKLSDSAVIAIHPAYRGNVMMKRASQVEWLVSHHASQVNVLATLADYKVIAASYQAAGKGNYEVLDFCESNLKQAADLSSGKIQQAITQTLSILKST